MNGKTLIVEDNMLIAMDAEDMLMDLGAERVEIVGSVADALAAIDAEAPDRALLDVNLGSETSAPIASRLRDLGIPYVLATGYDTVPEDMATGEAGRVMKPYTGEALRRAMTGGDA